MFNIKKIIKIITSSLNINKIVEKIEPEHFFYENQVLFLITNLQTNQLQKKIQKINNIYIEEIDDTNITTMPEMIQNEYRKIKIQEDCERIEKEKQEKLKRIKQNLLNLQEKLKEKEVS